MIIFLIMKLHIQIFLTGALLLLFTAQLTASPTKETLYRGPKTLIASVTISDFVKKATLKTTILLEIQDDRSTPLADSDPFPQTTYEGNLHFKDKTSILVTVIQYYGKDEFENYTTSTKLYNEQNQVVKIIETGGSGIFPKYITTTYRKTSMNYLEKNFEILIGNKTIP